MASKTRPQADKTAKLRVDWEAIERDRRTGHFSLRELERKYGVDNASISRRIRRDRAIDPTRWQQDLSDVVRQATNTLLMRELISSAVSEGQHDASNAVLAAAELNKRVLLRHHNWLTKLAADADALQCHVVKATDTEDLGSLDRAASALDKLGRIRGILIAKEREAFGLTAVLTSPPATYEQTLREAIEMARAEL